MSRRSHKDVLRSGAACAAAVLAALAAPAFAVTTIWDGGGANTNWDTPLNWVGDVVPGPANDVQFASALTSGTGIQTNGNRTANSLIINALPGFTILGAAANVLTLTTGNITRNDIAGVEANHQIALDVALGANGTWNIAGSGALFIDGSISGAGRSLSKAGAGTLIFRSGGTYSGGTFVNGGVLQLENSVPGTGAISIANGAQVDLVNVTIANAMTLSGGGIAGTGVVRQASSSSISGAVTLASNSSINVMSGTLSISSAITDGASSFGLTKNGAGTLQFGGANTYNGPTTITAGTLTVTDAAAVSNTSSIVVQSGASLRLANGLTTSTPLTLAGIGPAGYALESAGVNTIISGPLTASAAFTLNTAGPLSITGPIASAGFSITKTGSFPLSLTNPANNFSALNINGGSLQISGEAGLPAAAQITIAIGASAIVSGPATINRNLVLSGNGFSSLGALAGDASIITWSGPVQLAGNARITTEGVLNITSNISGSLALTKEGTGILALSGTNSIPSLTISDGTVSHQSGTSIATATSVAPGAALELSGSFNVPASRSARISGSGIGGQGALRTTNGDNLWAGPVTLLSSSSILVRSGGQLTISGIIDESLATAALTKIGPGTLVLSNSNTYSGGTIINDGTLIVTGDTLDSRLGLAAAPVTINGGKLLYTGNTTTSRQFNVSNGRLQAGTGVTVTLNSAHVTGGYLMGPGTFVATSTSLNGVTAFAGSNLTPGGTTSLSAFINGGNINQSNTLTWDGGVNTSSGQVTLGGTLTTTAFTNDGQITINNGATLLNTPNALTSGGGSRITINSGGTLNVSTNSLNLNGALLVNNGTISGTTNVNYGSLAKGAGVYGAVNVTDGGRFSPGNSPGTVTTSSTIWNSGGSYLVEVADSDHDQWLIDGILSVDASSARPFTIALALTDGLVFDHTRDNSWPVLHADAILDVDPGELILDASAFKDSIGRGQFSLQVTANDILVHFSAVPEPAAMAALPAGILLMRRRRGRCTGVVEGEVP